MKSKKINKVSVVLALIVTFLFQLTSIGQSYAGFNLSGFGVISPNSSIPQTSAYERMLTDPQDLKFSFLMEFGKEIYLNSNYLRTRMDIENYKKMRSAVERIMQLPWNATKFSEEQKETLHEMALQGEEALVSAGVIRENANFKAHDYQLLQNVLVNEVLFCGTLGNIQKFDNFDFDILGTVDSVDDFCAWTNDSNNLINNLNELEKINSGYNRIGVGNNTGVFGSGKREGGIFNTPPEVAEVPTLMELCVESLNECSGGNIGISDFYGTGFGSGSSDISPLLRDLCTSNYTGAGIYLRQYYNTRGWTQQGGYDLSDLLSVIADVGVNSLDHSTIISNTASSATTSVLFVIGLAVASYNAYQTYQADKFFWASIKVFSQYNSGTCSVNDAINQVLEIAVNEDGILTSENLQKAIDGALKVRRRRTERRLIMG